MSDPLTNLAANRPARVTCVCSAHPLVLEAALRHAAARHTPVLIEATCNQVNQEGGYTGQTPASFRAQVVALAYAAGLPPDLLLLGGDHLGPNPWTAQPAEAALQRAEAMVAAYVAAGFRKLHLDTSMPCAGDPIALPEATIAERAARLARVAEAAARQHGLPAPVYVIGTEVPPPGGAKEVIEALTPTSPDAAEATIDAHARAFARLGLQAATDRVIAVVVQPGVEFGTENVIAYKPDTASALTGVLRRHPRLVFEAHSTDYQSPASLAALARDGFALLKVGPGLTFALRETLYRLDALLAALTPDADRAALPDVMERLMLGSPAHWQGHYHGDARKQRLLRHYSYSDRIRYYWPRPEAGAAVARLMDGLAGAAVPETLISQYLPGFLDRARAGVQSMAPKDLLIEAITYVLRTYED